MTSRKKENDNALIEIRDHYVYVEFMDLCNIELEDAKVLTAMAIDLCSGRSYPFITSILGKTIRISNEAREYFASYPPLVRLRTCQAILVDNMPGKLLANFFIKFHKPTEATRVFTKLDDALEWIKTDPK
jgi:hypothetical protein